MRLLPLTFSALTAVAVVLGLSGCGNHEAHDRDHAATDTHAAGGHAHQPKYGGQLVELGEHQGNLELVLDSTAGKLTLYCLDAHAENFVRLPLPSITLLAETPGGPQTLTLQPVGNAATGEKPGNSSQFEGTADWLKSTPAFKGRIPELTVKATTFRDVTFGLPQ
jgi:hypothetical protein